jgi:hypothetical protein
MALRAKWQFMDRSATHKIVYGPQLRFGPYNILWVTSRSINCHMALSAMNYLIDIIRLYITMPSCYILQCLHVIYYNAIRLYTTMSSGNILQCHQVIYYNVIGIYTTMSSGYILQCHQVIYYNVIR